MDEGYDKEITIRAPRFNQYERVLLDFNEVAVTKIVNRIYEIDKDCWWYECSKDTPKKYPESAFSPIPENFNLDEFLKNY